MPANFDDTLPINNGFVEWPQGPLFGADGQKIVRVEVWIMQKSIPGTIFTGATQITYGTNFPSGAMSWIADQWEFPSPWVNGTFQPGCALGTAVLISTKGINKYYYWWSQDVLLV